MFTLKHFDRPLFDFDFIFQDGVNGECSILKIYEENRSFLPAGLFLKGKYLYTWLRKRVVSLNRHIEDDAWRAFGVEMNNTIELVRRSHVLSLNDCYWAVEEGKDELFDDFCLYDHINPNNPALAPYFNYDNRRGIRRYKNKLYFYKNDPPEITAELVAARLAAAMGLNYCDYEPAKYRGEDCIRCRIFTDKEHSLLTINKILFYHSMKQTTKYLEGLGEDYLNAYKDMMVFDSLICNEDRHSGNYGLIIESRTLKPVEFAPLFDHGRAFFTFRDAKTCEEMLEYAKTGENYYGVGFNDIAKMFISDRQKAQLRKALKFKMPARYYKYVPAELIDNIVQFIHLRAEELLTY